MAAVSAPADPIALLVSIGIEREKAARFKPKLTQTLVAICEEASISAATGCPKPVGNLLEQLATKLPADAERHRKHFVGLIVSEKIRLSAQVDAGIEYLKPLELTATLDTAAFERACGVGAEASAEQIRAVLEPLFAAKRDEIAVTRFHTNIGPFQTAVRAQYKFADGAVVKTVFSELLAAQVGPRVPEDDLPPPKPAPAKKEPKAAAPAAAATATAASATPAAEPEDLLRVTLPPPTANKQKRPELLEAHLKATGGKVVTRFPPEPNGYLHLGHAKAMNLDFGYAAKMGGKCYMRFDDTNPQKEKMEYIDSILGNIKWLGHTPCAITHSSDYFPLLYDYAVQLIKSDGAYVDHSTAEEMAQQRRDMVESKWRNRPMAENLTLFEDMRKGKFAEGEATLRLKCDMKSPNMVMRDLIAYRIKYMEHPMTGDQWCIYPTYDYTHCICDSTENITHSLCTLEFDVRRELYNWILDKLDIYRPPQLEFSRLNVTYMIMSKRKLHTLVETSRVSGWDDPRMPTLDGLRRRGYTPNAINDFCDRIGITRNTNVIDIALLEQCCRQDLDVSAPRVSCVLSPLRVKITNFVGPVETKETSRHPTNAAMGTRTIAFGPELFIDSSDFRENEKDNKDFYGLAVGKEVSLKGFYNITCDRVVRAADGTVAHLECTYDKDNKNKVKGHLHFVLDDPAHSFPCEVRLYDRLFTDPEPGDKDNWLDLFNTNSKEVITTARIEASVGTNPAHFSHYQFERVGYFAVDLDSAEGKLVFNRTVNLKESVKKAVAAPPAAAAAAKGKGKGKK